MLNVLDNLKLNGFVNSKIKVLSETEIERLYQISNELFESFRKKTMSKKFNMDYIAAREGSEVILRFPQQNLEAFHLMEKILNNKEVQSILKFALGKNYKLRQVGLRRSLIDDNGMYLHQDGIGETNLGILLSNNYKGDGATIFLPSSHLIKTTMKKWNIETPPTLLKFFLFLMKRIKGKRGDVFFFFNRTWHGRSPNKSNKNHDAILLSFHPNGIKFEDDRWDPGFLKIIQGTTFSKLIDLKINNNINVLEDSLALQIENKNSIRIPNKNKSNLFFMIIILRVIFSVFRFMKKYLILRIKK